MLVVRSMEATNCVLETFQNLGYNIFCTKADVFIARMNQGRQVKLVFTPFSKQHLLEHFPDELESLKAKFLDHYFFGFEGREF